MLSLPFLQTLTFRTPEPRQFPLGIQKPALSEVLANISSGTVYRKAGSPCTLSKSLKVIYNDLLRSKNRKSVWAPVRAIWPELATILRYNMAKSLEGAVDNEDAEESLKGAQPTQCVLIK